MGELMCWLSYYYVWECVSELEPIEAVERGSVAVLER